MKTKLTLALAVLCLGSLVGTAAMATPKEFVPGTPNLPSTTAPRPVVTPMSPTPFTVPEPGSLALVAVAALAAAAARRRKK